MFECYEDYFTLNLPIVQIDTSQLNWVPYNQRKKISRWGASLTSLDGETGGIPDLDSLYEYNKENGTRYREADFNIPTPQYTPFIFLQDYSFSLGRSHIIKLGSGGFFPYHRDFDSSTFRLIYTISGCDEQTLVWVLNGEIVKLKDNTWYYINTKMVHSVFSFFGSEFAVFNIINNSQAQESLVRLMSIK